MYAGQVKMDPTAFSTVLASQKTAITTMQKLQNEQQAFFKALANVWRGDSSAAFQDAVNKLTKDMMMGLFMTTTISKQTLQAQDVLMAADAGMAGSLFRDYLTPPQKRA